MYFAICSAQLRATDPRGASSDLGAVPAGPYI